MTKKNILLIHPNATGTAFCDLKYIKHVIKKMAVYK